MSQNDPRHNQRNRTLKPLFIAFMLFAVLVFAQTGPASAEGDNADATRPVDPKYRAAIREYISAQGATEMTGQAIAYSMAEQTLVAISQTGVEITEPIQQVVLDESIATFGKKFSDVDVLTDLYAPVYREHFTEKEIREITAFYKSEVGRKTIDLMMPITQAGNQALQEATFGIMPGYQMAVDAKLKAAGFVPAN